MPTTDEIIYDLQGATVFSELDFNKAFHQLELDEESRDITTVETNRDLLGLRRSTWLSITRQKFSSTRFKKRCCPKMVATSRQKYCRQYHRVLQN